MDNALLDVVLLEMGGVDAAMYRQLGNFGICPSVGLQGFMPVQFRGNMMFCELSGRLRGLFAAPPLVEGLPTEN